MSATHPRFRVLISGASGLIGSALRKSLSNPTLGTSFHPEVYSLVRHIPQNAYEIPWDPYEGYIEVGDLEDFDAVVHLAGENVGSGEGILAFTGRWTERKKHHIIESRRRGTKLLAKALSSLDQPPKVFVSASGIGYYGNGGDKWLTEASPNGQGFMARVADVWENETQPALDNGIRVVNTRFGMVLSNQGGALSSMLTPFNFGLGGPIGSGQQYMSFVALADAVRALEHCIHRPEISGPVNVVAPNPVTNKDFTKALASALSRPALLPMPEKIVRTVFGEMGEELLLVSQRAQPEKLAKSGFRFKYPTIEAALQNALSLHGGMQG